jgi:hypothetical protein
MPLALHEDRRGVVYFVAPADQIFQTAPAASPTSYARWAAQEEAGYEYIPQTYTSYDPNIPQDGEYAWTTQCGPVEQGLIPYTSILNFPFQQANYQSFIINPWQAILPDDPTWIPFPLQDIPADATITNTTWGFRMLGEPTEWTFRMDTLSHTNTVLPSISGPTPPAPDNWLTLLEHIDFIGLYPSSVNARAALLQDFNLQVGFKHSSGTGAPSTPHALKMAYFFFKAVWQGMDALAIDSWDGASYPFGMTLGGSIERRKALVGGFAGTMGDASDIKLIGNMVGGFAGSNAPIADGTNNEGGVDNGIDNTGWFTGSISLADNDLLGHFALESVSTFTMSADFDGAAIETVKNLSGAMSMPVAILGDFQKDGRLWVEEDALLMGQVLTGYIEGTLPFAGGFPAALTFAAGLVGKINMAGGFTGSMALSGYIGSDIKVTGGFNASMSGAGTIVRVFDITAAFEAGLSFWAGLTYDYDEPALEQNTLQMAAPSRTIRQGYRCNTIITPSRKGF